MIIILSFYFCPIWDQISHFSLCDWSLTKSLLFLPRLRYHNSQLISNILVTIQKSSQVSQKRYSTVNLYIRNKENRGSRKRGSISTHFAAPCLRMFAARQVCVSYPCTTRDRKLVQWNLENRGRRKYRRNQRLASIAQSTLPRIPLSGLNRSRGGLLRAFCNRGFFPREAERRGIFLSSTNLFILAILEYVRDL